MEPSICSNLALLRIADRCAHRDLGNIRRRFRPFRKWRNRIYSSSASGSHIDHFAAGSHIASSIGFDHCTASPVDIDGGGRPGG
jgi:hypothetical protein